MQNKLFIALLGTLGFNLLTPNLAASFDTAASWTTMPSWLLVFAGIFCTAFVAEKAINVYTEVRNR